MAEAQQWARLLVSWFWFNFELVDGESQTIMHGQDKVYWTYLAQQTKCLMQYKKMLKDNDMHPDGRAGGVLPGLWAWFLQM